MYFHVEGGLMRRVENEEHTFVLPMLSRNIMPVAISLTLANSAVTVLSAGTAAS